MGLLALLGIRRGILLSLTISSGFVFLDAYFQDNADSRARALAWVKENWQQPIDQITPSGISDHFSRIMDECSFGSLETNPPIIGCNVRRLITMTPIARTPPVLSSPGLLSAPTPGPFSPASPVPDGGLADQYGSPGQSRSDASRLDDAARSLLPLPALREPDSTPGAEYIPAIKAWLASWLVIVAVFGTVASNGWAGLIVFLPSLILATLLLALIIKHIADPRILLFIAVIMQVYLAGIGLIALAFKSLVLLFIGAIQWTLQSVILINILIQAADKIVADREAATLNARMVDLEQRLGSTGRGL